MAADLFDDDARLFRVVLVCAMRSFAAMAATLPADFAGDTRGFVVADVVLRVDLVVLYAWACRRDRRLRALVAPHVVGLSVSASLWLVHFCLRRQSVTCRGCSG